MPPAVDRLVPAVGRVLTEAAERAELIKAEQALRESEMRSYQLQVGLACAAEVQAKLLPRSYPQIPGFDVAARCLPAKQVGGDFFDRQEVCLGVWSLSLGDVMGKGMAAAMLMATVRASLRSAAHNRPEEALRLGIGSDGGGGGKDSDDQLSLIRSNSCQLTKFSYLAIR
ncbi:MAG: SpoIIE family protein phosphatase [Geobacteraceae bacterium]|nr:SpoIIE family protein phosphatase [Geobacteraceae bacterium]